MKNALLCFFLTILMVSAANAQKKRITFKDVREDTKTLKLSKEQSVKMDALKADYKVEEEAINSDKSLSRAAKKEEMENLRLRYIPKRDAIYTPEQRDAMRKYDDWYSSNQKSGRNKSSSKKEADTRKSEKSRDSYDNVEESRSARGNKAEVRTGSDEKAPRRAGPARPGKKAERNDEVVTDMRKQGRVAKEEIEVKEEKRSRRPGPPRPGKRGRDEAPDQEVRNSGDRQNNEVIKEKRGPRRPGPQRHRSDESKDRNKDAGETRMKRGKDKELETSEVKEEKRRRPGPPRPGKHRKKVENEDVEE